MVREATFVRRLLRRLNALPRTKAIKIHGSIYSEAGTPDILVTSGGMTLLIEAKRDGQRPTAIQKRRIAEWRAAGMSVIVATPADEDRLIEMLREEGG